MAESMEFSEWLPDDEQARMQTHQERQRRAQAAVKPHAEHREAERRLRAEAAVTADPDRRRDLTPSGRPPRWQDGRSGQDG